MENKLSFFLYYIICINDNYISQQRIIPNILRKKIPLLTLANLDVGDVVVGFSSQYHIKYDLIGIASYIKGYVLLRKMKSDSGMIRMLKHELCHLFGAFDLAQKGSIMDKENPGQKLEVNCRKIPGKTLNNFPVISQISTDRSNSID